MKKVKLVRLGGYGPIEVEVEDGATLRHAAEKAGLDLEGMSVRISGDDIIAPGDKLPADREVVVLTVASKVEGGRPVDLSEGCPPEWCDGWEHPYYGWTPVRNSGFLG